ncbi:3033_t:CDS:2, partial [Entrophospora sp. SA101]
MDNDKEKKEYPHFDAINGLDDLRSWTLNKAIQEYIPIYLTENTLENIKSSFPYLVDKKKSSGGGDLPSFQWNIIDSHTNFTVEGLEFTPLQVHHGTYFDTQKPYFSL